MSSPRLAFPRWLRSLVGRKFIRYSLVSVVAVAVSEVLLTLFHGVFGWSATWSNVFATALAAIPSYELNRRWAWRKTGPNHIWKEIVPFWALAFLGLLFSTVAVHYADRATVQHHLGHLVNVVVVDLANILAFGILWVAKFIIYNKVLFVGGEQSSSMREPTSVSS